MKNVLVCVCTTERWEAVGVCVRACALHVPRLQTCAISLRSGELSKKPRWVMPREHRADTTCLTWLRQKKRSNNWARQKLTGSTGFKVKYAFCARWWKAGLYRALQAHKDESIYWMTNIIMCHKKVDDTGALCGWPRLGECNECGVFACVCASRA